MVKRFDVPIGLFLFKRIDTTFRIVDRISEIQPQKIYLISDQGRDEEEKKMVAKCRKAVEDRIQWDCEVIKYYADNNRGVYENIGEGAKWVLTQEKQAIFLEDDNLPEVSFFYYCKELLQKYEKEPQILWICGTNYLGKYEPDNNVSYMFTKHLLPCGWASWGEKFCQYYDGEMKTFSSEKSREKLKRNYENHALFKYQFRLFEKTAYLLKHDRKRSSWDYQMAYSVRNGGFYGISPKYNQIENIGVDEFSTHGGNSFKNVMTKRFCGMKSYSLELPLVHPARIEIDEVYEREIGKIILPPLFIRMKLLVADIIKKILRLDRNQSLALYLKDKKRKNH